MVGKARLGELFSKERKLRLPLPFRRGPGIGITENALRILITVLISLFLLTLAVALALQLVYSRKIHLAEQTRETLLFSSAAAESLRQAMRLRMQSGHTPQAPTEEDLAGALHPDAVTKGRVFAIVSTDGLVTAAEPPSSKLGGQSITRLLPKSFVTETKFNDSAMTRLSLPSGGESHVAMHDLAPLPGSLLVMQSHAGILRGWWDSVMQVSLLFSVTFLVLMMLGGAFHWQAARAAEADRTLAMATNRLDMALERGQCGLWDWDIAQGRIFWSKSMYDILGLDEAGEFLSFAEVAARLHPEDPPLEGEAEKLLKGEIKALDHEFRMRHADGGWVWLKARAELSQAPGEDAPHLVGIAINVTEQKIAEKLNKDAEERLSDAIGNISEAFVLWNADNQLVLCNSKYKQFHSLPDDACLAGTPYEVVARAAKEPVVRQRMIIHGGEAMEGSTFEVQLGDGRWLQINERRTHDGGFVSVGTDITALKKHEERLVQSERELMMSVRDLQKERLLAEQQSQRLADLADKYSREKTRAESANRSKTEFLHNMSHELRTPLNAVIGFSEVMESQMFGPIGSGRYLEYAKDIHRSGQFLLDVINDILDMSKIEAGRFPLEITTVTVQTLVEESLRIAAPRASQDRIEIVRDIESGIEISADKRALKQVLLNLLSNALKFTPEGGRVTVSARRKGGAVEIAIADTGEGIPPRDIEKLGRPFEQLESQLTKKKGGSGLGLAISKSLVELHTGSLHIASEMGRGTTVTVRVPDAVPLAARA